MADSSGLAHYQRHIIRDPKICVGEPVFKGTRVRLRTPLASLATGDTPEDTDIWQAAQGAGGFPPPRRELSSNPQ
jgi:hypothetical protein